MILFLLALLSLLLAGLPCLLFLDNLRRFHSPAIAPCHLLSEPTALAAGLAPPLGAAQGRRLAPYRSRNCESRRHWAGAASRPLTAIPSGTWRPAISVLIPARDEAAGIRGTVAAVLASQAVDLEVVVLDDHSSDATPSLVAELSAGDPRVRLIHGQPLPAGWNGKQYACWQLAQAAENEQLLFLDADVRLRPDALWRLARERDEQETALLSAFPHQQTGTLLEHLLIPMMHVILLCFLPLARMRRSRHPSFAAGCGQCFFTTRSAYEQAGTHAAIRQTRHDGLRLPFTYRLSGQSTDVVDGTAIAECRMYRSAGEVMLGLLKNAHEGIANVRLIIPFTVLLLGGAVLPPLVLAISLWQAKGGTASVALAATLIGWLPRWLAAVRFRQSYLGALLHPLAVLLFVGLQWLALLRHHLGRTTSWRGRS